MLDKKLDENSPDTSDAELLQEIRDNYRYGSDMWREARENRRLNLRYLSGDPWEPADRKAREDAGRPCINHDELGQFVNQAVNNVRQNKRGVKVEPEGNGADDKSAEFRQNKIRAIEYKSKAGSIYANAYQAEVEGGYGYCRISRRYVSPESDEQEIVVTSIPNPDSVLYDPDCKEPDWSDAQWCFVLDPLARQAFKKRWPKAQVKDFTSDDMRIANDWITDRTVLTAEYWRIEAVATGRKTPKGRPVVTKKIVQYWTNGLEILERTEQPGDEIPIPAFIAMQRWRDDGSGTKRQIVALPDLARDPQMSLAYLCSQQMEEAGLTPKTPYLGYTGQFETDAEAWETATKIPHAYLQADPITDSSNGQVLPLPRREPFTPNFAAFELAKDSCRRAVQAAMGISALPTAAQRDNQKSGVALDRITAQQAIGSFHLVDGYELAIERAGRIMESWIDVTYDTERETALRLPDEKQTTVRINTEAPYVDHAGAQHHYLVAEQGDHGVTISTAPSNESQRDAASEFLDILVGNLGKLPVAPPQAAKLLSLAIQMKQLGPLGDQMAEIISPDDQQQQMPPQAMQAVQMMQGKLQQLTLINQQLQAEMEKLQQEKQGRVLDNEYKIALERMKIEAQMAMAEINTKAQALNERVQFVEDVWKQLHGQSHEAGMQAMDQQHAQTMAQQQADAAAQLSAQQAPQQQTQQETQPQA